MATAWGQRRALGRRYSTDPALITELQRLENEYAMAPGREARALSASQFEKSLAQQKELTGMSLAQARELAMAGLEESRAGRVQQGEQFGLNLAQQKYLEQLRIDETRAGRLQQGQQFTLTLAQQNELTRLGLEEQAKSRIQTGDISTRTLTQQQQQFDADLKFREAQAARDAKAREDAASEAGDAAKIGTVGNIAGSLLYTSAIAKEGSILGKVLGLGAPAAAVAPAVAPSVAPAIGTGLTTGVAPFVADAALAPGVAGAGAVGAGVTGGGVAAGTFADAALGMGEWAGATGAAEAGAGAGYGALGPAGTAVAVPAAVFAVGKLIENYGNDALRAFGLMKPGRSIQSLSLEEIEQMAKPAYRDWDNPVARDELYSALGREDGAREWEEMQKIDRAVLDEYKRRTGKDYSPADFVGPIVGGITTQNPFTV